MFVWLLLFWCISSISCISLTISSTNTTKWVYAIHKNSFIGPQTYNISFVNDGKPVLMSLWNKDFSLIRNDLNCTPFNNTFVLLNYNQQIFSWARREEMVRIFANCKAKGVLHSLFDSGPKRLGFEFHLRDAGCCLESRDSISIPYLSFWHEDGAQAKSSIENGESVFMTEFIVSKNQYDEELFEQTWFLVIFRILLPLFNSYGIFRAILAVYKQTKNFEIRKKKLTKPTVVGDMISSIVIALLLEVFGCGIRVIYCAVGPIFSNSDWTYEQHMYMFHLSIPIQLPVIFVVICLFYLIVHLRKSRKRISKSTKFLMTTTSIFVLVMELVTAWYRTHETTDTTVFYVSAGAVFITLFISTALFVYQGSKFMLALQTGQKFNLTGANLKIQAKRQAQKRFFGFILAGKYINR